MDLLRAGIFSEVDVAMMAHPYPFLSFVPSPPLPPPPPLLSLLFFFFFDYLYLPVRQRVSADFGTARAIG